MAKARAMVDVVRAEAGAHQLLEEVGFLVRALGAAEAGERIRAVAVADLLQAVRREIERFFPARLAEDIAPARGIDGEFRGLHGAGLADEGLREALRMLHVVEAEASLHAQALVVRRAVAPVDAHDRVLLD